ncbi:MAG TPA: S53 family peptidase [Solirubrobacteraceae bacterium]|nr:S53 family peptidase [Solirubrobacteraceae bacterium]
MTALLAITLGPAAYAAPAPGTHLVPGYLNGLPLATKVGAAPASQVMTIGVELNRPDTAGELTLYNEIYQPGSAQYHHFLTPAQFDARFGVPASTVSAARSWLTGGGLSVQTASNDYFTATGTVAELDRLLQVNINRYTFQGKSFIANDAPPSVPDSLSVAGIAGLDTINRFTFDDLHGHTLKRLAGITVPGLIPTTDASHPQASGVGPQAGDQQEFTPQELWGIYDDPGAASLTKANGTSDPETLERSPLALGQGQKIGIFGEGETSSVIAQLRLFETAMGFPKVPVRVRHTEGGPDSDYGDNTGAIEWYLDSQSSTGMSPDVSELDFYFAKTLFDADIFQDFNTWANDPNGPREMNASFGECEANPTNPVTGPLAQQPYGTELGDELQAMGDPILRQASMEGRTLLSSAGDTGSGCPELVAPVVGAGNGVAIQPVPFVGYPCDSEYVVCVGGTVVSSNGTSYPSASQRAAETSWTYSGGGSSHFIAEPGYQQGVANIDLPCTSQPDGSLYAGVPPTCRGVPDVADLSGNITGDGYFIYIDGEPSSEGGTSLASPLMMGQWARVQSAASRAVQNKGGLGFANPVIYGQAKDADGCSATSCPNDPVYSRDFFDITQSEYGAGNGAYQPGPGWDYASGWGSLNVANFIKDVDGSTSAPSAAARPEADAVQVTTASMTSPAGNATDPVDVSLGNQPSLDLTRATLTTSSDGSTVVATLSGPSLGSAPPSDAPGGNIFRVAWEYGGKVYYAEADQPSADSFTYTSGNTGTYGDSSTYGYNGTSGSAATGSFDAATHTITIKVPAKEVGSPSLGSALTVPQAFDQLDATALALTTDSSDDLKPISVDGGLSDSIGEEVIVGGAATGSASGSATFGGGNNGKGSCAIAGPVVHAGSRVSAKGIKAHGVSSNHGCGGHIVSVGVALARSAGRHKCRFLLADGKFGKVTSCRPRHFLKARGTVHWTFQRRLRLPKGVYLLWAHATNSKRRTTRNTARKHIFMRLR